MTSRAAVSHFEIFDVIKNFELCNSKDKLKSKTDHVWVEICSHWLYDTGTFRMNPTNLYFYVRQDRNGIYESYKRYRGETFLAKNKNTIEEDIFDEERDSEEMPELPSEDFTLHPQNDTHLCKDKILKFEITFSETEWTSIKPSEKTDKNKKKYWSFQKGWTHIVCELIYVSQKLPCAFNLTTHNIYQDDTDNNNFTIKINGFCTDKNCRAAIYGEGTFNFSTNEHITLNIITLDTKEIAHKKKRHISGPLREEYKQQLKCTKTENFRSRLIEKFHEYGQQIPPIIPNLVVCNKIRQEAINEDLGTHGTLWESLDRLRETVDFKPALHQSGKDKFFLFYWTPEQINVYNDLLTSNPCVSIDATGSIVRRIPRKDNYSNGPIFLYQIVTHIDKLIVPVCQMLSERHDTSIIGLWLRDWFSNGAQIPLEIVTDMSKPLQNAICLASNNLTYNQYLLMCYRVLTNKSKKLVQPYLRIDISHFIHWISRLRCFVAVNAAVKDFYLRVFGLMTTIENFCVLEKLMRAVLKVSQNNYNCSNEIKWLLDKIKTFEFDESIDYKNLKKVSVCEERKSCENHLSCLEEGLKENDIAIRSEETDELDDFLELLITETCPNDSSDTSINYNDINSYYCPGILPSLKIIFKKFPSWSNVMRCLYNCENEVPVSARSENYFSFAKNNLLVDHQSVRLDKFLVKHLRSIFSKIKEARAELERLKLEEKELKKHKSKKQTKITIDKIFNLQENWKNQVQSITLSSEESDTSLVNQDDILNSNFSNDILPDKPIQVADDLNTNSNNSLQFNNHLTDSLQTFDDSNSIYNDNFETLYPIIDLNADLKLSLNEELPEPIFVSTPIKSESMIVDEKLSDLPGPKYSLTKPLNDTIFSLKRQSDEHYSITLDSKPPSFRLKCNKMTTKRKNVVKNKSSPKSKRGKYVTPFPEVDVLHAKVLNIKRKNKKLKKKKIIRNGQYIRAYPINGRKLRLFNTCPFDSLMEVLSFTYLNFINFKTFVDNQIKPNSFFSCLQHYTEFGADVSFNKKRLSYLFHSKRYPEKNYSINCRDDVSRTFSWIMTEYDCNTEQTYCTNKNCNYFKSVKAPVLNVNATLVWKNGLQSLEECITQEVRKKHLYPCDSCKKVSAKKIINITSYLCLNVEHFYDPTIYFSNHGLKQRTGYYLEEIPVRLTVFEMSFLLAGVIEYVIPDDPECIAHYIAYIRSINNVWTQINDMEENSKKFAPKKREVRAFLLFYVRV